MIRQDILKNIKRVVIKIGSSVISNKDKGQLSIDNIPIEKYSRSDLGSQVAMVLQDPFLFQGSLKENLKFNQQSATDEEMINACKSIGIHDYITSLENGYDTSVSERGVNMSQGQRQLMGFARALIKNPKILILDEATSNIAVSYTHLTLPTILLV